MSNTVESDQINIKLNQEKLSDLLENYVLCGGEFVINLKECKSKEPMTIPEFKASKKHLKTMIYDEKGKEKIYDSADLWQCNENRKSVRGLKYFPSDETFIVDMEDGTVYYNTYYIPNHIKPNREVNLDKLYEHLTHLFPREDERNWFLDWLAFSVQRPDLRSPITPMHISIYEGTGRGLLVKLLFSIFGFHGNVQKCDLDAFGDNGSKSQFNGYLHNSVMCVIEESKESEKQQFTLADKIKSILTDTYQQINIKHKPSTTERCYTNFWFISNNPDAIVLRDNDRRFNVFMCDLSPKSDEYYDSLAKWLGTKENIAAIYHMLKEKELDIDAFMSQKVMKNEARERLIQNTTNDFEAAFNQVVESKCFQWATIEQVFEVVRASLSENESEHTTYIDKKPQLTKLLQKKQGVRRVEKQLRIGGKRERPWCFDDAVIEWKNTEDGKRKIRECIAGNNTSQLKPIKPWNEPIYSDDGKRFNEEYRNSYQSEYTQEELQKMAEDARL